MKTPSSWAWQKTSHVAANRYHRIPCGGPQALSIGLHGEFRITKSEHPAAYASAGLSYDTKFDLSKMLELPHNDDYFSVPPHAPHGQSPQLGTLHPSMVRIAAAAFAASRK
jgi:hypothetical protein